VGIVRSSTTAQRSVKLTTGLPTGRIANAQTTFYTSTYVWMRSTIPSNANTELSCNDNFPRASHSPPNRLQLSKHPRIRHFAVQDPTCESDESSGLMGYIERVMSCDKRILNGEGPDSSLPREFPIRVSTQANNNSMMFQVGRMHE